MSRVRLKEYQNTYAEQMAKYGLKRGIEGSEAKHVATSQYYRDLLNQTESVQENISALLDMQNAVKEDIFELETKQIDVRRNLDMLQAEGVKVAESVQVVRSEHQQAKTELSKVKADISKEKLKNSASDVGSKLIDGVSSLLGTPKVVKTDMQNRELKAEVEYLSDEIVHLKTCIKTQQAEHVTATEALKRSAVEQNSSLREDYHRRINSLEQRHKVREQELTAESNSLKRTLSKLMGWMPLVGEMLRIEKLCTAVGFTAEQISQLVKGVAVRFSGSLYSKEHKRRFETQNSTAKVVQESQTQKLHLIIDGNPIAKWFAEKYTQYKEQQKAMPPPKRGMRI